jgi:hypothetical protein
LFESASEFLVAQATVISARQSVCGGVRGPTGWITSAKSDSYLDMIQAAARPESAAASARTVRAAGARAFAPAERSPNANLTDSERMNPRKSADLTHITDSILHLARPRHVADADQTDSRRMFPRKSAVQTDQTDPISRLARPVVAVTRILRANSAGLHRAAPHLLPRAHSSPARDAAHTINRAWREGVSRHNHKFENAGGEWKPRIKTSC